MDMTGEADLSPTLALMRVFLALLQHQNLRVSVCYPEPAEQLATGFYRLVNHTGSHQDSQADLINSICFDETESVTGSWVASRLVCMCVCLSIAKRI